jgi:hypothetical protein
MYRSLDALFELRRARFHERRAREGSADRVAVAILGRRAGRVAAGAVGSALGLGTFVATIVCNIGGRFPPSPWPAYFFAASAPAAGAAGLLAALWVSREARRALLHEPATTGDTRRDLQALAGSPLDGVCAAAERLERAAVGWPLVALASLTPFAAMCVVGLALDDAQAHFDAADCSYWLGGEVVVLGWAQLAMAAAAALWGFTCSALKRAHLDEGASFAALGTWLATMAASYAPTLRPLMHADAVQEDLRTFLGIVAFLTFWTYGRSASRLARERNLLAAARAQPWNTPRPDRVRP